MVMESPESRGPSLDEPSKYGLKLPLNHVFPLQTKQAIPRSNQVLRLMPLTARYMIYYLGKRINNKRPIMDYINMVSAQRMYGCPIGGIGGGTIGRGFKGEFCRFQIYPGFYEYVTVPECQFIVNIRNEKKETIFQSVLSTYDVPKKAPQSWEWNLNAAECDYTGLYPRAWTSYDLTKYGVKIVCRQISPVIPHNYKDSSLPCAVFVFTAHNVCGEYRDVSITFTWTEVLGNTNKKKTENLELGRYSDDHTSGVTLEQRIADTPCTFTIAKRKVDHESIHDGYCLWNGAKSSKYVWECIEKHGKLIPDHISGPTLHDDDTRVADENKKDRKQKNRYKYDSLGITSSLPLYPGESGIAELCLAWDMPVIKYKNHRKIAKRFYTKYFGSDGLAGPSIAEYAIMNYRNWEKQLSQWQNPILNNRNIPDWLKSALMNELYFIADGGTIWFDVHEEYPKTDPRHEFGLFGYLEGHEYRMYNTYDVHFYASFALAQLWPNLQVVIQYMYRDAIGVENDTCRQSLYDGKSVKTKVKDCVPHDLGDPDDIPFSNINAYNIHDVSEWRDLNLKFILQVMRDHSLLKSYCNSTQNSKIATKEADIDKPKAKCERNEENAESKITLDLPKHSNEITDTTDSPSTAQTPVDISIPPISTDLSELPGNLIPETPTLIIDSHLDKISDIPTMNASMDQSLDNTPSSASPKPLSDANLLLDTSVEQDLAPVSSPSAIQTTASVDLTSAIDTSQSETLSPAHSTPIPSDDSRNPVEDMFEYLLRSEIPGAAEIWHHQRFLAEMYPACAALLRRGLAWDKDGDGLIENSGTPNQTFDTWVMTGPGAYCSGLWLAAVSGVRDMARALGRREDEREFAELLGNARRAYEDKLWNGTFYLFDSLPANKHVVMANQLAGNWYLRASGSKEVFPEANVKSALTTVYENNVLRFRGGRMGAVNGYVAGARPRVDGAALQSEEMWTGVTYAVAAQMIYEGMHEEAFVTAGGLYKTLTEMGLSFETPEALYENGNHRSVAYMRPLSVWAMYQAIMARPQPSSPIS